MKHTVKVMLALHLLLMVYSSSSIFSKLAADQPFLSLPFCFYYGMILVLMAIYAIGWQQIIKRMPLSSAYANKAVTVIWGIVWGVCFFGESLSVGKCAGAILIMAGIALYAKADGEAADEE